MKSIPLDPIPLFYTRRAPASGYWRLDRYPWGGEFHRFADDVWLPVLRVVDTYTNGAPRRVIAMHCEPFAGTTRKFQVGITL